MDFFNEVDLTIVMQGPFSKKFTNKSISSVRHIFPDSLIIFVTWNSFIDQYDFEYLSKLNNFKLILLDDPGNDAKVYNDQILESNSYRMIYSTSIGLAEVNSKWVLRMRNDIVLKTKAFLDDYFKLDIKAKEFNRKILVVKIIDPRYSKKFFIDDWFEFGTIEDVSRIFLMALKVSKNLISQKDLLSILSINNMIFTEKVLWGSVFDKFENIHLSKPFITFFRENLLLVNNFNQKVFINLKYPKHGKLSNNLFKNISYLRFYELNYGMYSKLVFLPKITVIFILRRINYIWKSAFNKNF